MLVGFVTGRQIGGVPTLVAAGPDEVIAVAGRAIQRILVP